MALYPVTLPTAVDPLNRANLERLIPFLSIASGIAIWELAVGLELLHPLFASSPTRILSAAVVLGGDPRFWGHIEASGVEFLVGYASAAASGVLLGFVAGWYRTLSIALDPLVNVLYATPRIALLPVLVLWLGLGTSLTIAMVFLGVFFVVLMNTMAGVKTVDPNLVRTARSFGARDGHILKTIAVPAAIPFVVTGLRLGVARGLIGVVIGELFGASQGLGYFIHVTASTLQVDRMFVAVLLIAFVGLFANILLSKVERRLESWRPVAIRG